MNGEKSKAYIWWNTVRGKYDVRFPYDPDVVQFIKSSIPLSQRWYDKTTRTWSFAPGFFEKVRAEVLKYFEVVEGVPPPDEQSIRSR